MWPNLVDYSKEECKQMLRRLELEAYSSVVNALRAQGEFNQAKAKILQDLSNMLSITLERHQAEIRRAVNDEKLSTIAYHVSGEKSCDEWTVAGRRLIPLLPRLIPQNQLTSIATQSAMNQAAKNESLPEPSSTAFKSVTNKEKLSNPNDISSSSNLTLSLSSSKSTCTFVSAPGTVPSSHSSTITCKRFRLDNGTASSDVILTSPNGKQSFPSSPKAAVNLVTKSVSVIPTSRTNIHLPPTYTVSSSGPRVVFMSSNGTTSRTLTVNDVSSSNAANILTNGKSGTITKARVVAQGSTALEQATIFSTAKRIIKTTGKPFVAGNSGQGALASTVTPTSGVRIIPAKSINSLKSANNFGSSVVIIPASYIPLSQPIKQLQVPSVSGTGNASVAYQSANPHTPLEPIRKTTIRDGTITIQTLKPPQGLFAISQ